MAGVNQTTPDRTWSTKLLKRWRLTESTFALQLSKPNGFTFQPGQRITLRQDRHERDYTLINALADNFLAVLVRLIPSGQMTPLLDQAPIGARLSFTGPVGHFRFQPGRRPAIMVATGTGIAPFVAMIRAGAKPRLLLHGVRTSGELYYREELAAAAKRYVPCLSTNKPIHGKAFRGHVTHFLQTRPSPPDCDFYLAGRMEMIHDAMRIIDARFPSARVFTEAFF